MSRRNDNNLIDHPSAGDREDPFADHVSQNDPYTNSDLISDTSFNQTRTSFPNKYDNTSTDPYLYQSQNASNNTFASPFDEPIQPIESIDYNNYYQGSSSNRNPLDSSTAYNLEDQDYLSSGPVRTSSNQDYYGASTRKSGFAGVYNNIKSKLGLGSAYTEMDLPLTDQGRAKTGDNGIGSGARADDSDFKDEKTSPDFDIRKIFNKITGKKEVDPSTLGPRIVHLNNPPENYNLGYRDNHISTTKYNVATFLPKFLFEQFSKYANLFFLFTSAIQQVPNISPTNRYTTIGTLAIVLLVSAVKELVEDFKRGNADKELNNSTAEVLVGGVFEAKRWIKVSVGDIIRVKSEEPFPADLVLVLRHLSLKVYVTLKLLTLMVKQT